MALLICIRVMFSIPGVMLFPGYQAFEFEVASFVFGLIQIINVTILAYSASRIRSAIKQVNTFPNENLTRIHIVNSIIYSLLYLAYGIGLSPKAYNTDNELLIDKMFFSVDLIKVLLQIFSTYMDMFLLYLIMMFTKTG